MSVCNKCDLQFASIVLLYNHTIHIIPGNEVNYPASLLVKLWQIPLFTCSKYPYYCGKLVANRRKWWQIPCMPFWTTTCTLFFNKTTSYLIQIQYHSYTEQYITSCFSLFMLQHTRTGIFCCFVWITGICATVSTTVWLCSM